MSDWDSRIDDHRTPPDRSCEFCGEISPLEHMPYPDGSRGWVCFDPHCRDRYEDAALEVKGCMDGHARREEG
jgi:hypothetical protein